MNILKMPAEHGSQTTETPREELAVVSSIAIPPPIVTAIASVQNNIVGAVEQDQTNKHAGYKFASTDAIYAALMKLMAAEQLVCLPMQVCEPEKVEAGGKTYLKFTFQFVLSTPQASWTHEWNRRSVWMAYQGPQTFQGGQSYAEKAFLKALFKLATGDLDLEVSRAQVVDQSEYGELPKVSKVAKRVGFDAEGRPTAHAARKNSVLVDRWESLSRSIPNITSVKDLDECKSEHVTRNDEGSALEWGEFPKAWAKELQETWKQRRDDLLLESEMNTHGMRDSVPEGLL